MSIRRSIEFLLLLTVWVLPTDLPGADVIASSAEEAIKKARELSAAKHRDQAIHVLEDFLEQREDGDVRLVLGLVLSWNGEYGRARRELKAVLLEHPDYTDAARALANVELWSDHPDAAEELTNHFLEREPDDRGLMVQRVRALRALKRRREAFEVIAKILQVAPGDKETLDLREGLREEEQAWKALFTQSNTWFSDGFSPWSEQSLSLKRGSNAGSTIFRVSRAHQFGLTSDQLEIDSYPHLWKSAYAYVNAGYSPDHNLYPTFRFGSDVYQSLGRGWETSGGFRRLIFSSTRITVYTGLLGRYHRSWYFSGRTFLVPDQAGPSRSIQLLARHYFGFERYLSFRYGTGASPFEVRSLNEVGILNSQTFASDANWFVGKWSMSVSAGWAREDRVNRDRQGQYNLSFNVARKLWSRE